MMTFIAALLVFAIAMTAMAVGVLFSNRRLKGSCGGTGQDCDCAPARQRACTRRKEEPATQP